MKITKVNYTKAFVIGAFLQEKIGVEIEIDDTETPEKALSEAKRIAETWHIANNPQVHSMPPPAPYVSSELPVINTAEEKLAIEIENATTMKELMVFQNQITTPYLADIFSVKLSQLKV